MKVNLTPSSWILLTCLFISSSLLAFPANDNFSSLDSKNTLALACNDDVQVSVDENCQAVLLADMILEGGEDNTEYSLIVMNGVIALTDLDPANINNFVVGEDFLGLELTVRVIELATDNFCWGAFTMEDKAAPIINCDDLTISCTAAVPVVGMGITATDNCSAVSIELVDESTNTDGICDAAIGVVITRTYTAIDAADNQSVDNCLQQITITRPTIVDFPDDIAWYCSDVSSNPNLTAATELNCTGLTPNADLGNSLDATNLANEACLANSGSGVASVAEGLYCNYGVSFDDEPLTLCENAENTFKIIRTWTVLDWCSNQLITFNDANDNGVEDANEEDNVQVIKVIDNVAPIITLTADADLTLSTNVGDVHPQPCKTTEGLPVPMITDDCSTFTYSVFTEVGEATVGVGGIANVPSPGLAIGSHEVIYVAIDQCGNTSELTVTIEVVDDLVPTAVCDELTQVAIGANGIATVLATTFDDGSNDNCSIDRFEVRRMTDACGIVGNTQFGESIQFCCADIGQTTMLVFRVYDYYDNIGECMVEVLVEDKLAPFKLSDATDTTTDCDDYFSNIAPALDIAAANGDTNPQILLDLFGEPIYGDNCESIITANYSRNINSCGAGTIIRTWSSIDPSGNVGPSCSQTITVNHINDWNVQFPADVDLICIPDTDETAGLDFGEPIVFDEDCELIAKNFEDQLFTIVDDACYKILRTHTVINWCVYEAENNGDDITIGTRRFQDGTDGIVSYIQAIKVQDTDAPIIADPGMQEYCIDGATDADSDCDRDIELIEATASDCSTDIQFTYAVAGLGTGRNYADVVPGIYAVTVNATDNCGNQSTITYDIEVVDCKAPTPYCVPTLIIELMPDGTGGGGMAEIWASDFNAGAFDNCTDSEDLIVTAVIGEDNYENSTPDLAVNCGDVFPTNINQVYIYFEDEAGNIDYCLTTLIVESVPNLCAAPSTQISIAGFIETETGEGVELTDVGINGGDSSYSTDDTGAYSINVPTGGDYTVVPSNDLDYDNGVTTFDLVLIRQHILTTSLLDSPYKMIAADVNSSGAITSSDLVALRSLILNPAVGLNTNTSWRFIAANYIFPNPNNPWSEAFPEVNGFNNLEAAATANFVGIKIGDVNGSVQANQFSTSADERGTGSILFEAKDKMLVAGETYTINFSTVEEILGYQFTLDFAPDKLDFIKANDAKVKNFGYDYLSKGALTASVDFAELQSTHETAFSLTFQALENAQLSEVLSLNSRITKTEAYTQIGVVDIDLIFKPVRKNAFQLYSNTPNPFADRTQISFNLPIAERGILTIRDTNGKIVKLIEANFTAGRNVITINDLTTNGVYYYNLNTATHNATRKMVKTK